MAPYSVLRMPTLKVVANEVIVGDTNVFLFARASNICCGHKICVRNTLAKKVFVFSFTILWYLTYFS